MKEFRIISCLTLFVFLLFAPTVSGAENVEWSVNEGSFEYDMTVYASLELENVASIDMSSYDVAAFVGNECRGIAEYQTASKDGTTYKWLYLRIRSNSISDEVVTFKARNRTTGQVTDLTTTVNFVAQSLLGLPSSPFSISNRKYKLGDVNGDTNVNIVDAVCIVNYILEKPSENFIFEVSDVNNDGNTNIVDAVCIVNIILYGKISLTN